MEKILKIQSEIGVLSKDKENPFLKSSYFDINSLISQLQPLLAKHEILVIQPLTNINGKAALCTEVYDLRPTDKKYEMLFREVIPLPDLIDPQKMGSAITYYRRYALQSLFLLQAEDDDGNKAKPNVKQLPTDEEPF